MYAFNVFVCIYMFVFNISSHLIVYTIKNNFKNTFIYFKYIKTAINTN